MANSTTAAPRLRRGFVLCRWLGVMLIVDTDASKQFRRYSVVSTGSVDAICLKMFFRSSKVGA
jgi:hypothetical protein